MPAATLPKRGASLYLIGMIFLFVGLLILVGAWITTSHAMNLLNQGVRTPGEVMNLEESQSSSSDSDGSPTYAPVVRFETKNHQVITQATKSSSNPPTHHAGDRVKVIYAERNPTDFVLDEPFELWGLTWIFGGLGSIFTSIGGGMIVFKFFKGT